jgi:hypothetical protein
MAELDDLDASLADQFLHATQGTIDSKTTLAWIKRHDPKARVFEWFAEQLIVFSDRSAYHIKERVGSYRWDFTISVWEKISSKSVSDISDIQDPPLSEVEQTLRTQ